jgi:hypothetical protein
VLELTIIIVQCRGKRTVSQGEGVFGVTGYSCCITQSAGGAERKGR